MGIDFGDFDFWYASELLDLPMDGVGTGEMDFMYAGEYLDIYSDGNPPATPILGVQVF